MARSFVTDPLMTCNFAIMDVPVAGIIPLAFPVKQAMSALSNGNFIGAQSVSVPEQTLETRAIKVGNQPYVKNVLTGTASSGDVVISWAVFQANLDMWAWWLQAVNGAGAPRRHIMICHTRQDRSLPARIIYCESCIPIGWKPADDFDANSSQVSLETMTLSTERVRIIPVPLADIAPRAF